MSRLLTLFVSVGPQSTAVGKVLAAGKTTSDKGIAAEGIGTTATAAKWRGRLTPLHRSLLSCHWFFCMPEVVKSAMQMSVLDLELHLVYSKIHMSNALGNL